MTKPLDERSPEYVAWFNEHVHEREPNDDPPVWWTPDAALDLDGRDSPVGSRDYEVWGLADVEPSTRDGRPT